MEYGINCLPRSFTNDVITNITLLSTPRSVVLRNLPGKPEDKAFPVRQLASSHLHWPPFVTWANPDTHKNCRRKRYFALFYLFIYLFIQQTLQTENYGQKFVLVNVRSGLTLETHYKVIRGDNAFNTQVIWLHSSGPSLLNDGDGPVILVAGSDTYAAEEFEIDPTTYSGNPPYATVTQFLTGKY